jgi:hypothetical protein
MQAGVLAVKFRAARPDRQGPAAGHRVAGIDGQVQQHLPDLAVIGHDGGQLRRRVDSQFNLIPDAGTQQVADVGNDDVEIQRLWLGHLSLTEDKQLPGERRGPLRRRLDLLGVGPHAWIGRRADHKSRVAHNDGQQVVEVMGDPARQPTESFEALRRMQLLLQHAPLGLGPVAFGHVPAHARHPGYRAARVPDRRDGNRHIDKASVLAKTFRLVRRGLCPLSQPSQDGRELAGQARRDELGHVAPDDLISGVAVHLLRPDVPAGDDAVERPARDGVSRRLEEGSPPRGQIELLLSCVICVLSPHGIPPEPQPSSAS